ncbi:hypothetical protein ACVWZA_001905 [Sphingomonas sp. UYAg733]
MLTYRKKVGFDEYDESEAFEINERELHLVDSRLVMRYMAKSTRMTMSFADENGVALSLKRLD